MVVARDERSVLGRRQNESQVLIDRDGHRARLRERAACGLGRRVPRGTTQDGYRDGYYDRDYRGNRSEWRDERIENRVEYALSRSLGSDANDINVQVRNRNVYLSGRVDRPVERVRAPGSRTTSTACERIRRSPESASLLAKLAREAAG
jgi:hypothetical protein